MNSDYVYFDFFGENRPEFDKVRYQGKDYFIFGRRKSGYFDIRDLNGEKINKGSISYKKLRLVETRRSYFDVVGKYNTKEEACKKLNFEYERKIEYQEMFLNGIDPEWMKSSHCDNEEAILYINGEEVHVWQIVTA